ncbi:MAG: amino-acid N-acetyltransferase, partial [Gammaproteobacteria bacterium]|nr:amino-acid N-acetyltransferase [Gammaproteobacteria bacterium]
TLKQAHRLLHQILDSDPKPENSTINHLRGAIHACSNGVNRTHLLDSQMDGALLLELFTRDGVGCMVCADFYENIHRASIENVGGIMEIIEPLEEEGVLVRRPREKLEQEIGRFTVVERDGAIIACGALYPMSKPENMELACLAVSTDYRNSGLGEELLERLEKDATNTGVTRLFVLTTHTSHWFRERGFENIGISDLPFEKQATYNYQRNSKVLVKNLLSRK